MRLTAISVGRTRTIEINGCAVRTAFVKNPVPGRVRISREGVDGNEVAVHTDAVYAFAWEAYGYWAAMLGKADAQWPPGFFGENLTVAGLDEGALRIGDRVRVGAEVELIVAGPRIPCFKLAWRLDQPESFIQRFASSGRTGVYFSVAREGTVEPGDEVVVVHESPYDTVADAAGFMFGDSPVSIERLRELLSLPCLSQTAALFLRNRMYRILDYQQTLEHRWPGWRSLRVARVEEESADIRSWYLSPVDGGRLPRFRAGQFLTMRLPDGAREGPVRTWSLSDYDEECSTYRVSVRRQPGGVASGWMHEHAEVDTVLEARAPAGRFVLDRGSFKPVILIGAGVGITPLLAMARSHRARGRDAPPLYLIYCVRDGAHHAFRAELDRLADTDGVTVACVYSQPRREDVQGRDYAVSGRLTLAGFAGLVSDAHILHGGRRVDLPWYDCDVYLCGPQRFQTDLLAEIGASGIDPARIRRESFAPPAPHAAPDGVRQAEVILQRSNRILKWSAADQLTLLELLEQHDVKTESGCRLGICRACLRRLVAGTVDHSLALGDLEPGAALLCCASPTSSSITLDC